MSRLTRISYRARAKINLDLLITGQRDDGYHLLDSLVVFADYGDEISVCASRNLDLRVVGPFADGLMAEQDNIVLKAARLLQRKFDISQGAEIELAKNLPVSSGIGGGSADAAATLRALIDLWQISCKDQELDELLLSLGTDVPVCMAGKTRQMCGIGEKLYPLTIKFPLYLLLVNPGLSVSTAGIFRARAKREAAFSPLRKLPDEITSLDQLRDILQSAGNDLEYDACRAEPEIIRVLDQVRNGEECLFAGMSGSGATCFGIFPAFKSANEAAHNISHNFPEWWVQSVRAR